MSRRLTKPFPISELLASKTTAKDTAVKVLDLVVAGGDAVFGEDDNPSPVWSALGNLGGDEKGWEVAQSIGCFSVDLCEIVRDGLRDGAETQIPGNIISAAFGFYPDMKDAIEDLAE